MTRIAIPFVVAFSIASVETTARAAAPAPAAGNAASSTVPEDPQLAAQRARVVTKGKRMQWSGLSLSFGGLIVALGSSLATPVGSTASIVGASTGVVLAATGLGLTIAGFRRIRHPEKFMRRAQLAASPWGNRTGGGATLVVRF